MHASYINLLSQRAPARNGSVYCGWIDMDRTPGLRAKYDINDIPTTLGYKSKQDVNKYVGPIILDTQTEAIMKKTL